MTPLLRTDREIVEIYERHVDVVYRLCFSFMKSSAEAEDMVQETFVRLITSGKRFESESHERAWLIVTASNLCKDSLKKWWRQNVDIDQCSNLPQQCGEEGREVLSAIMQLPDSYKTVVYMYYYEGYSTKEIASSLHCLHSTVRSRLARARKLLRKALGGEYDDSAENT